MWEPTGRRLSLFQGVKRGSPRRRCGDRDEKVGWELTEQRKRVENICGPGELSSGRWRVARVHRAFLQQQLRSSRGRRCCRERRADSRCHRACMGVDPGPCFGLPFGRLSAHPVLTLDPEATQTAPSQKSGPKPVVAHRGQVEQTRWADLRERLLKKKKRACWSRGPASLCSHWSGLSLSPKMGLLAPLWLPLLPAPSPGLSLCSVGSQCCHASRLLRLLLTASHAVS